MNESNIRVAVSGANGRMGRQIIRYLLSSHVDCHYPVILSGALTQSGSKFIGYDVGRLINSESVGIIVNDSIEVIHNDFDVLIDFSYSQGTLKYLDACKTYKKNMVIGTTGFTQEELLMIQSVSNDIGIVFSPNFSVMMNLMLTLLKRSASVLKKCLDIEILEMHHRNKSDIPSGTALRMKEVILSGLSSIITQDNFENIDRYSDISKVNRDIKINSIRAGDIVGEHSVFFIDLGERLELTHKAFNREIFVNGAVCSVAWLGKLKVGLFNMLDVLGINEL